MFRNVWIVFKRELSAYFGSLLAYMLVAAFVFLAMFICLLFGQLLERSDASLDLTFFQYLPWLFMFFGPAIGMGLWSEEHRQGTIELLMTMPLSPWQAILGKFLAACVVLFVSLLLTFPIVITLWYLGDPDNGKIFAGYVGAFLVGATSVAVTCLISALTRSQIITVVAGIAICFLLTVCSFYPVLEFLRGADWLSWLVAPLDAIGFISHSTRFANGLIRFDGVFYFLSVIAFCLFATSVVIRAKRA